ncbi:MAG: 23S rRNA (guanosine(2251)-2'-O)-methyltransferase RlmB [Anaerolineaceae bacterium]|nr:23S rRNA (guanosine(2251)-2'-O)-methyltransferase RlmB [Anaerolineaceae bacterium]
MAEFLYGHWAVLEALRANRRPIEQLLLVESVEEKGRIHDIIELASKRGVNMRRVPRRIIDDLADGANHQNVVLRVGPYPYVELEQAFALAEKRGEKPFFLLLDLLKDPQNVGSLLRVADAVGLHGVILPDRRSVSVTPAVVNASAGAIEHLNVIQVTNLVNAMKELKSHDVWLVGLDIGPDVPPIDGTDLNIATGLVLGSEGEGMRRLVRDTCDMLLSLPMRGQVASLNVATVGSIALYSAWQARGWEGWGKKPLSNNNITA